MSLLIGGLVWESGARAADVFFFPPLSAVVVRLVDLFLDGTMAAKGGSSLVNLSLGLVFSLVFGLLIGLLMGAYRRVELALDIYVRALLMAPSLVFAPVFFALFGFSSISIIAIIVQNTMFIIIMNTAAAVRTVPRELLEMGRTFGASDRFLFRRVVLPAAAPLILAGVRLGAGRAVKGLLSGELFIAVVGLGSIVAAAGRVLDATTVLAVMLFVVLLSFVILAAISVVERRVLRWLPKTARS